MPISNLINAIADRIRPCKHSCDENMERFFYSDVSAMISPKGWVESKLANRLEDGYEIWRDERMMGWRGKRCTKCCESKIISNR